jgi:hypothetical protein
VKPATRTSESHDPIEGRGVAARVTKMSRMENWPVNLVGLGLIIAGILFAYFLNFVGIIIGLIMIIGGIVALWMTYRRKKYPATQ